MSKNNQERTVIIIDGKNFCYRHAWTHRDLRSGRQATGMLYGCITGLLRLARLHPGAVIVICWDGEHANLSWRHRLAKDYKSNRNKADAPQFVKDMRSQIPLFMKFLELLGFKQFKLDKLEADDLIGILSSHVRTMADRVLIYSTDRDFYQLIRKNVYVVRDQDKAKMCKPISRKEILKEHGVEPKDWLKYRGIVGDPGDHIMKPKGYGPKTALKLIAAGVDVSHNHGYPHPRSGADLLYTGIPLKDWELMRLNYKLSKILKDALAKQLTSEEGKECQRFLKQIKCIQDMERTGKKEKVYKDMLKFLALYEFEELMRRRKELWELA